MFKRVWIVLGMGLCLLAADPGGAHTGEVVVPIYELPTADLPDLHDGTLEDWVEVLPEASLSHGDFLPILGPSINPGDLAFQIYLAWHGASQRIYLAIERFDDRYINTYEGGQLEGLWAYDNVDFMVDGDHAGEQYNGFESSDAEELGFAEKDGRTNFAAQQYFAIAAAPDRRLLGHPGLGLDWVTLPPFADAGGFLLDSEPHISAIELYVTPWDGLDWSGPEQSVRSRLEAGRIIGMQIGVPDFDAEPGEYDGYYTIAGVAQSWRFANVFVDGLLVPCQGGDCGIVPERTAVQGDSWGRIKASFGKPPEFE
ncbi:MAG: hypothetical protein GKR89_14310 [Candidatus Latescibacteria bacterium]|nr:hypothetical protein [Candidatus Latescibacterota bacterium]